MPPPLLTATSCQSTSVLFKWVARLRLLKRVMSYSFSRQQGVASKTMPIIFMTPNVPEPSLVVKKNTYIHDTFAGPIDSLSDTCLPAPTVSQRLS